MSNVYLDSSVLVAFLYEAKDQPSRFQEANELVGAIRDGKLSAAVSFYALPELYSYVKHHHPENEINSVFRLSLVELFSLPLLVVPFVDRSQLNQLRQQITISDRDDARHVAAALSKKCNAMVTFDHDFQQVSNLIPAYTPAEFLATLTPPESAPDSE